MEIRTTSEVRMKVHINNYPINFEIENEKNLKDVISSISRWARERDLIFLQTQVDEKEYNVEDVPDEPLDNIGAINCIVESRADVVMSSLNEGKSYCDKVLFFIDTIQEDTADLEQVQSLAYGIDWLKDVLVSTMRLLDIDMDNLKLKEKNAASCLTELEEFKNSLDGINEINAVSLFTEKGAVFQDIKSLFMIILLSRKMKDLILKSIDSPDSLALSLAEIKEELPEQMKNLEETAIAFQTGQDDEGSKKLNHFIDFLYRYHRTCFQAVPVFSLDISNITSGGLSLEEKNSMIFDMLNEIVDVMENNDIISLTDILEYEIKPLLEDMDVYIDEILKTIIQD